MKENQEADRIWYGEDAKLNVGSYESVSITAGFTTNVLPGETPQAAFARAQKVVRAELLKKAKEVRNGSLDSMLIGEVPK